MDLEKLICKRTAEMKPSGIRRFFDIANEMEGVVSLGVGEPDFKTPYAIRRAAIDNLQRGNTRYTANSGLMELRKAISDYMRERFTLEYDPTHEIMVTVGGSEGIDLAVRAFIEEGDEVLIPEPSYVAYAPIVSLTFGVPVPIPLKEENNFRLTAEELEAAITPKTKMLMLPFPNNPTGSIMRREHLEAIAEVLRRHDNIVVVSDEIYAELTYNGRHVSIAELPDMWERTIIIGGFSKAFSMTGWRLGYLCAPPAALSQMLKIHQYALMCSPTTSQWGGVEALRNCIDSITAMRDEYNLRRRFVVDEFNRMGLHTFEPEGAFYVFPCIKSTGLTSEKFCEKLLYSKKIAVVPGDAFGASGEGFIRVSYCYSVNHLTAAVKGISEFLDDLRNGRIE
ncbi:MAG TPA: aminotransferase class I/II-fold pyridoxal phosphate-dependent enzyme [Candidatus Faecivivens stercorigallinarum]|nr:aminotransferase class I/II-fold pyridoxal phosphate-dependent enzyme [Candidatus Faecivivens stercorigallinarum]